MNGHIIHATKFSTDVNQFQIVAENPNLSKNDLRIFIFLCCRLNSKHYVKIDKSQISESLNIPKKKVTESIDNLVQHNIIMKGTDNHTKGGYIMYYTGY